MLHLSKREDVAKVLYIEPALNVFRLLIFPFSELRTFENRRRWARALRVRVGLLSNKLFLFTPVFLVPFSFRNQFIYNLNLFVSFLVVKTKIKGLGFDNIILWLYHPFDHFLLRWFKSRVLSVFDWAENWAEYFIEFDWRKKEKVRELEEKIVRGVDIVFVVSKTLLRMAKKLNENSHHLLDGTVYEVFQKASDCPPEDIRDIKKPILGYLGTINERVDIELLEFISRKLSQASLVLIGDIQYQRIDISGLKNFDSIYLLGGKSYEELGSYTKCFDVCILPYRPALSPPTKIFDYLATGKPIVSTNLAGINRFKDYLYIADSKEEFVDFIKIALAENKPQLSKMRLEAARNNTWQNRVSGIIEIIRKRVRYE